MSDTLCVYVFLCLLLSPISISRDSLVREEAIIAVAGHIETVGSRVATH